MGKEAESVGIIKPLKVDPSFKYEVMHFPGGEALRKCFQCGTCTSSCPIARFSRSYRPREIIRMAQLGFKEKILKSETLWICAACFTCIDRCPQDVEVSSILRVLKNMAVAEGYVPDPLVKIGASILESGLAYNISSVRLKKREKMGLPPLPESSVNDLLKLAEATGFNEINRKMLERR